MENRRENIEMLAVRLKELESEIGELEKLADKAVEELKDEYRQQINYLFLKKEELNNKVLKIKEASGNTWEDMKAGTELSWEVFNESAKGRKSKRK
jgi:phosphopantetheine adenylyltransferase